jgi:hypothetical protein
MSLFDGEIEIRQPGLCPSHRGLIAMSGMPARPLSMILRGPR